ncbi:MAG: ApbE family lipoprotein, partial [Pseudonocardiales bacterium]|nr:ApbE family lipoprotein [Pseudonocardiales bacterium]
MLTAAGPLWTIRVFSAWSCTVRVVVADPTAADSAEADVRELMAGIDREASRFRRDSALSLANRHAGRPTPIPRALASMVHAALDAAAATNGAVDPTIGQFLIDAGYDRDIALVAADGPPSAANPAIGPDASWRAVRLDREAGLLTVPIGCALDVGATAKAFTADRAANLLHTRYRTGVLVEIGGDLAVAGAAEVARLDPTRVGWPIAVAERQGGPGQRIVLFSGGLATSTTTVRTWRRGGQIAHHIIDPRTDRPTEGPWRTATVPAP